MKRRIKITLILVFTILLAGCAGPAEQEGKVTLTFMHRWTMEPMKSATEEMIRAFEKENPDIKINVITEPVFLSGPAPNFRRTCHRADGSLSIPGRDLRHTAENRRQIMVL